MSKRTRKLTGGSAPRGHFCRVCGEHKANEQFSGKGHAAHICKACAGMPIAERNEMAALRKIEGMAYRYLTEDDLKWLRDRLNDPRPTVRDAARAVHRGKFPRYERDKAKKGMTALSLELYIRDTIPDGWGDAVEAHARVFAENTGAIRFTDYNAPEPARELTLHIDQIEARRLLKAVVHELDAPFWDEDLSDAEYMDDPYLDVLPEYRPDVDNEDEEIAAQSVTNDDREPLWSLRLELNTGANKEMVFYNQTHDEPVALFWSLMEYFESEDEDDGITE